MNERCSACILVKRLEAWPAGAPAEQVEAYRRGVRAAVTEGAELSSPEVAARIARLYRRLFGPEPDYGDIKRRFNALMLGLEPELQAAVDAAPDPLKRAVQYAMAGNFIDFAALDSVDEARLGQLLRESGDIAVDGAALEALRRESAAARRLVYLTDNCGEIVADKLLLRTLRRLNPRLEATAIVRGEPVVNDATLDDARQVDLAAAANAVIGNGCDLPGTVLSCVSAQARSAIEAADLVIAKGQANYEGLSGCGLNVFYIFMCKCDMFVERFGVPRFSGVLAREPGPTAEGGDARE